MESDAAIEAPEIESPAWWNTSAFWWLGLVGLLLFVYGPALRGPLLSDDFGY